MARSSITSFLVGAQRLDTVEAADTSVEDWGTTNICPFGGKDGGARREAGGEVGETSPTVDDAGPGSWWTLGGPKRAPNGTGVWRPAGVGHAAVMPSWPQMDRGPGSR